MAVETAMKIFVLSKAWPKEERYSLTDQTRRSSRSVSTNIAEAWRKRRYVAHFTSKLSEAFDPHPDPPPLSQGRVRVGVNDLSPSEYDGLDATYNTLSGGLVKMMTEPEKWCGPSTLMVREEGATYDVNA